MRKRWLIVMAASLALTGCTNMNSAQKGGDEEDEGNEVKVAFTDLPAPVRETLEKESNNADIKTVDKETKDGKVIYEADAMVNGQNWEIKVDPDGKLIKKKLDNEEGENKSGKEEDEEHENNHKPYKD